MLLLFMVAFMSLQGRSERQLEATKHDAFSQEAEY
jgi:hypothetical protein